MESKKTKKITIHEVFWYFVIFSILGLIVETLFCYVTSGNLESRKGFIWGPFCPVYGVGGAVLIVFLNRYQNNDFKIFVYGGILGSAIEYIISFLLEAMYGTRFWDYSYLNFHLNGRICITYTVYWAILSLLLMKIIKPAVDKVLNGIPERLKKVSEIALAIFLCIDALATVWGTTVYKNRALDVHFKRETKPKENNIFSIIENDYFTDRRMYETFPNLRVRIEDGQERFISEILREEGKM